MSSGPENRFIHSVHAHLPPKTEFHREKMNNPYSSGTADCWYSGRRRDLWIEFKFIVIPKKADTEIRVLDLLSALQDHWLRGRWNEGRAVWVAVGSKEGGVVFDQGNWHIPITAAAFRERLITRATMANVIFDWCR